LFGFHFKRKYKKYLHLFDSKNYKELNREIAKLYKINDEELNYIVIYNQKVEGENKEIFKECKETFRVLADKNRPVSIPQHTN